MNKAHTDLTHEQKMRITAIEFASCMYLSKDGSKGDNTAGGFIAFANQVYKYLNEGVVGSTGEPTYEPAYEATAAELDNSTPLEEEDK